MSDTQALLSTNWYRVAGLRPRVRGHVRIHRHAYRGEVWYVMEDRVAGKYHRFNPASHRVISLMDGRRDMAGVWSRLTDLLVRQRELLRQLDLDKDEAGSAKVDADEARQAA